MEQSLNFFHRDLLSISHLLCDWYREKTSGQSFPLSTSYDLRDSGQKIAVVDANIFPSGFNNICPTDKEMARELIADFILSTYGSGQKKILMVTEEHTKNKFYWENISAIVGFIESAGHDVFLAFPSALPEALQLESLTGKKFTLFSGEVAWSSSARARWGLPQFDLVLSNNDFSVPHKEWAEKVKKSGLWPMNPPWELGWHQRKKSSFFHHYNEIVSEFCSIAKIDPFWFRIETAVFKNFEVESGVSQRALLGEVTKFYDTLVKIYENRGMVQKPFIFLKNNQGTYGLGVLKISDPSELENWSYDQRKKMKAAKGGAGISELIIQEGVPSKLRSEGATAEPVIYMIGSSLAGGFLRTHPDKSESESLNSPGAVYHRLCMADLELKPKECPMEHVYGWVTRLAFLAVLEEIKSLNQV
jgi:glutamate--cysteine ligase